MINTLKSIYKNSKNKVFFILPEKVKRKLYNINLHSKIKNLRKKKTIKVLFILNDLSKWKTEELYKLMLNHERFEPIIGVTIRTGECPSALSRKVLDLLDYLKEKEYHFVELTGRYSPCPDIVIYPEPYGSTVPLEQSLFNYWNSLIIYIAYSCHTALLYIDCFSRVHECAWLDCYESLSAIEEAKTFIGKKRKSIILTGLPIFDSLKTPPLRNPWKKQNKEKKKIIWAPHHSLGGFENETIVYGNFLEMHQYMVDIALKFQNDIQIAFKPHPLLREKLEKIWGANKTDKYYNFWHTLENGQLDTGDYTDLFKYSDALIHDSSSFIVEYQIVDKPSIFIVRNEQAILKDLNSFGKKAFYSQVLGKSKEDVESFITNIINGNDLNKNSRHKFLMDELSYVENSSSSQRIIDVILNL